MIHRNYITLICVLGWSASTLAAQANVDSLANLPWISVLISGLLSFWGGLIATLQKMTDLTVEQKMIKTAIFKDLLASIAAGFIAYNLGMWGEWNVWLLATALLVAGYGGSRILDALLNLTIRKIEGTDVISNYSNKD